jgi:hypothetical protein
MLQASYSHNLGTTRAGAGTRLWLEGKRLLANGFNHRMPCERIWAPNKLTLRPVTPEQWAALPRANRTTIAGTAERPIIDITGVVVATTFPTGQVIVTWSHASIVVEGI